MLAPVEARASKFSTSGAPSAVIFPLLVKAAVGRTSARNPILRQIAATIVERIKIERNRIAERKDKDIDEPHNAFLSAFVFMYVSECRLKRLVRSAQSLLCLPAG